MTVEMSSYRRVDNARGYDFENKESCAGRGARP